MRVCIASTNLYHVTCALLASVAFWVHKYVPCDEG
jgi:hypothetical protein